MLSYRHGFHAGNFADVLKHAVLVHALRHIVQKPKPVYVLDTHAGAGSYDLTLPMAHKTGEFQAGIGRLLQVGGPPPPLLAPYLDLVRAANAPDALTCYPGSPALAAACLRPADRLELVELHPTDHAALDRGRPDGPRMRVMRGDGLAVLLARMPPPERRGVVLVDPSYELAGDPDAVVNAVNAAWRRFATGTFLLWYPVIERSRTEAMLTALARQGRRLLRLELCLRPDRLGHGMTGAGMMVINPPWTLATEAAAALPWLARALGADGPVLIEETA